LGIFVVIERTVDQPLFRLSLFRLRAFTAGNIGSLMMALGRGGLQFMLIMWLQGIWLPLHGYSFEKTPLWAGIYMIPLTVGFLLSAPVSGWLSDRFGARMFTVGGAVVTGGGFVALMLLPTDFNYWVFAVLLVVNGLGSGLFASPNRAEIMNALPANSRGVGAGMGATFQNSASVLSIGIFFSLMIVGLSHSLPSAMHTGLVQHGVPENVAAGVSQLPPIAVLFAAFLGYNPFQQLLGPDQLSKLPDHGASITNKEFFPNLISGPFHSGLVVAFWFAIAACAIALIASLLTGKQVKHVGAPAEPLGEELAAVSGEAGIALTELVVPEEEPVTGKAAGHGKGSDSA
jgi:MFS family permease